MHSLSALLALAASAADTKPIRPPENVVVIVLDDVGVDLIGAYDTYFQALGRTPGTPANTPAIDNLLAARGLTFANAWSCPSCTPSRAQLLTGRYPFRTGIGSSLKDQTPAPSANPGLSRHETLLPELLHTVAFECAAIGKWHLADLDQLAADLRHPLGRPAGRWFDRYAGPLFNLSHPPVGSTPGLSIYNDWLKTYASELVAGVDPCGGVTPCQLAVTGMTPQSYATANTVDDALAVMADLREPWFLYLSFNACHQPVGHTIPAGLPSASCGAYAPPSTPCAGGTEPADARCVLEALDQQIGRFLCAIEGSGTSVILVGDNGTDENAILPPFNPAHSKGTLYQGGIQVPLIVRARTMSPAAIGAVSDALVSTTDIFATVAELARVPSAAITAEDSVSLMPYLYGQQRSLRATVYSESFVPNFTPLPITGGAPAGYYCERHFQTLRNARFKLIRRWKRDHQNPALVVLVEEFYDLLRGGPLDTSTQPATQYPDPYERNDLLKSGIAPGSLAARSLAALRLELDLHYPTLVQ